MQTIETKYVGPSNVRGSRIIATSSSRLKVTVSYDCSLSSEDAHKQAVIALCNKLEWTGHIIGGHTRNGMVWVFTGPFEYSLTVEKQVKAA